MADPSPATTSSSIFILISRFADIAITKPVRASIIAASINDNGIANVIGKTRKYGVSGTMAPIM